MLSGFGAVSVIVTPSVLITAGSIVLSSLNQSYKDVTERIRAGEPRERQHRLLHDALAAVLVGVASLVLSVIAITLAVAARSHALEWTSIVLVIIGALMIFVGMMTAWRALGLIHDDLALPARARCARQDA